MDDNVLPLREMKFKGAVEYDVYNAIPVAGGMTLYVLKVKWLREDPVKIRFLIGMWFGDEFTAEFEFKPTEYGVAKEAAHKYAEVLDQEFEAGLKYALKPVPIYIDPKPSADLKGILKEREKDVPEIYGENPTWGAF